jgi:Flp pilus assembly protein TadG
MRMYAIKVLACERGSALAEMVIVLPMLVLVLLGLIEVGRYGAFTVLVSNAARAGVQYGAQNLGTAANTAEMQNAALADAQSPAGLSAVASNYCQCADGTASTCQPADCAASHRLVFVQVITTGTFASLTNYPGLPASLRSVTVSSTAVMRVAQ